MFEESWIPQNDLNLNGTAINKQHCHRTPDTKKETTAQLSLAEQSQGKPRGPAELISFILKVHRYIKLQLRAEHQQKLNSSLIKPPKTHPMSK